LVVKVTTEETEDSRREIVVVENWFEELERVTPTQ